MGECFRTENIHPLKPGDAYIHQWTGSLIRAMTCRLFGAKPLPKPALTYCQLDPKEKTSVKYEYIMICTFSVKKMHLKMLSAKCRQFCSRLDVQKHTWWRHQIETFSALLALCEGNIPPTKASDAGLWCFLWSAPEQTVEQIVETQVIWDAIVFIMTSL